MPILPPRRAALPLRLLALACLLAVAWPGEAGEAPADDDAVAEESAAPAAAAPAATQATFAERRQACLDAVAVYVAEHAPGKVRSFPIAAALFAQGKDDDARIVVAASLDTLEPGNKINRWMFGGNSGFTAWPGIDCYIRNQARMDEGLRARFKAIYTGAVFYKRLTTSNHKIMAATARYLATQEWGEAAFVADPRFGKGHEDGTRFANGDPSGEKYIRNIIADTITKGPGEYASRPYGAENVLPLLTIAECAKDKALGEQARFAYELCLIQLGSCYLRGHLATFSTRSYPDAMTQSPWGVAAIPWVYFGGVTPPGLAKQWAVRAAIADYRMPDMLNALGNERSKPFFYRAHINGWALSHYVNRSYVLFSRSPKASRPKTLGQNYPCGVMWDEPDTRRVSHLWITNPAADSPEPGSRNNPQGIHTHGIMSTDRMVQAGDACLTLYDIPPDFRNPYVLAYVPGGHRALINDGEHGRILLHYGSVLIAITSSTPFTWDPAGGIRAPATKPAAGDSEFRITASQVAVGLETAHPDDFPAATPEAQLAAFALALKRRSAIRLTPGKDLAGGYVDRRGTRLECDFDGQDSINGTDIDYARWPWFESPWLRVAPDGSLLVTAGGKRRSYDPKSMRIGE